jgi:hypothetical protein
MLELIEPGMWERDRQSNRFAFSSRLRRATRRVVVSGRVQPDCDDLLVKIVGRPETEISLLRAGRDVYGACNLPETDDAELTIEASVPPARLACWSFSRVYPSDFWHRALPVSLIRQVPIPRRASRVTRETVASELASRSLPELLGEVAGAWLGGGSEEVIGATKAILEHLDSHPLHRTNALGAFVAALCQPQSGA